jgi:hypothetical protein
MDFWVYNAATERWAGEYGVYAGNRQYGVSGEASERGIIWSDRSVLVFIEGADDSSILYAERRSHDQNVEHGAAVLGSTIFHSLFPLILFLFNRLIVRAWCRAYHGVLSADRSSRIVTPPWYIYMANLSGLLPYMWVMGLIVILF